MIRNDYLKIKDQIPNLSGVYTFRDKAGKPLYIGKAKNLANRVRSYFSSPNLPMIKKMVFLAHSIIWQETLSDIEALILESVLIKKYRSPFNVLMRDDKQYFYVGFTKEPFPRLLITHQPRTITSGELRGKTQKLLADFVGPFTDGGALKLTLKTLRKIFPYCTCKQKHQNYCLNYHIGNCLGFCCLKNIVPTSEQKSEYQKNVLAIKNILNGRRKNVIHKLVTELKKEENFTNLAKISKLQRFFLNTEVIKRRNVSNKLSLDLARVLKLKHKVVRVEGYDISNISGLFATGSMVVFTNGLPDKNEYRKFKIKTVFGSDDIAMLREILSRRLRHTEWSMPDLILIDGGKGQVNVVKSVLKEFDLNIPVVGLIKNLQHAGEKLLLDNGSIIPLSSLPDDIRNLLLSIDAGAHRFAIQYYRKRHSFK